MAAETYNIVINQGSNFSVFTNLKNSDGTYLNLSGYSARGVAKNKYSDISPTYNLNPYIDTSYISGLVIISGVGTGTSGIIPNQYLYDCEIYNSAGYIAKFLKGYFEVLPEVSR